MVEQSHQNISAGTISSHLIIQPKTKDLNTTLWGINPTNICIYFPEPHIFRSIVLG